eukprot:SM000171S03235  [mRNA]  locus=s171:98937:100486:- [translate_table: standard]
MGDGALSRRCRPAPRALPWLPAADGPIVEPPPPPPPAGDVLRGCWRQGLLTTAAASASPGLCPGRPGPRGGGEPSGAWHGLQGEGPASAGRGHRGHAAAAGSAVASVADGGAIASKSYEHVKVELVEGGAVGLVRLARPKALNALSEGLLRDVVDAFRALDAAPQVGAIVLTGEGKAFAAGADIKEMKDKTFVDARHGGMLAGWDAVASIKTPIIAAVNGYALGGGCELALMCDIVLASERAVFGQPEVTLGVLPGMGGTQRLARAVGKSRAMEMILTGSAFMDAHEAAQRGLASRVIAGDDATLLAEAVAVGAKVARLSRPAVALAKEAVNAASELGLSQGILRERALFCAAFGLEDQKEGMDAFVSKRKPVWKHK